MHYHTAGAGSVGAGTVCGAVCAWDQPWSGRWIISGRARNYVRVRLAYQVAGRRTTHARTRQHEGAHQRTTLCRGVAWRGVSSPPSVQTPWLPVSPQVRSSWTIHNLGIIYISLRAIISGPGRAHRVSDKFEPRVEATACGDVARRRRSRERYEWTVSWSTGSIDEWRVRLDILEFLR